MNWFSRLKEGLKKTSGSLGASISGAFRSGRLDEATLEMLQDALIQADMGIETAQQMIDALRGARMEGDMDEAAVRGFLASRLAERLEDYAKPLRLSPQIPHVIVMTGVNGSGKTTTIGKLAAQFHAEGKSVMVAAADTYRAGAVEQLKVWAERIGIPIIMPEKEGADPASLVYRAHHEALANKTDILLVDTAGRLQNRSDLMEELGKIIRVLKKQDETAPHHTLLVLDGTVGQNAFSQVRAFKDMADVNGLMITKLDSSAKGGVVVGLADTFHLPIHAIGVGEQVEDLQPFDARAFANMLLDVPDA